MKLGTKEMLLLSVIQNGLTAYQIAEILADSYSVSRSATYTALAALVDFGLVESVGTTTGVGGRQVIQYGLNARGESAKQDCLPAVKWIGKSIPRVEVYA